MLTPYRCRRPGSIPRAIARVQVARRRKHEAGGEPDATTASASLPSTTAARVALTLFVHLQKPKPASLWTTTPPRKSWPTSNCRLPNTGRCRNTPTPTPFSNWSRTDPEFQTAAVS